MKKVKKYSSMHIYNPLSIMPQHYGTKAQIQTKKTLKANYERALKHILGKKSLNIQDYRNANILPFDKKFDVKKSSIYAQNTAQKCTCSDTKTFQKKRKQKQTQRTFCMF